MKSKARIAYLEVLRPYIREEADKMRLKDWEIILEDDLADECAIAQARCTYGQKQAYIRLGKAYFGKSPEVQRQTIAHELTHLQFAPMHNGLRKGLTDEAYPFYLEVFEHGIDAVAEIIALTMDMPPVFKK